MDDLAPTVTTEPPEAEPIAEPTAAPPDAPSAAPQAPPDGERRYVKALLVETRAATEGGEAPGQRTFRFRATTGALDRQGEVVEPTGWETADFLRNPVFLLAHDYRSLPIGKVTALTQDADGLLADVVFDQEDPNARLVESKFARGFLNAVSVGFQPIEVAVPQNGKGPLRHTKKALLEISAVSVPANPDALMVRALVEVAQRAEWTAAFINSLPDASFAVVLPGGEKDSEGKTTPRSLRKLPHHDASGTVDEAHLRNALSREPQTDLPEDAHRRARAHLRRHAAAMGLGDAGKDLCADCAAWHAHRAADATESDEDDTGRDAPAAVARGALWESAAAGMVALLTPGSPDTAADEAWRQRAYHLLERLYRHCGKTPPEFRSAADLAALGLAEFRGLFWEGELAPPSGETRAGRTLSRANEQRIRQIGALAGEVLATLGEPTQEGADGGKAAAAAPAVPAGPDATADDALLTMQRLAELLAQADGLEALGIDAAARKALAPQAPAAPADDTTAPALDFDVDALAAFAGSGG